MIWVIFKNKDCTEFGCTLKSIVEKHIHSVDGERMKIVKEFEAEDFESAKQIYNKYIEENR
jgi:hypothetical protein